MFSYTICDSFSEKIFRATCRTLEERIPDIHKKKGLHDVDDSRYQLYTCGEKKIEVYNSYQTNAVYIDSEMDLSPYIVKK